MSHKVQEKPRDHFCIGEEKNWLLRGNLSYLEILDVLHQLGVSENVGLIFPMK